MSLDKNSFKTLNKSNIIAFNEAYLNTIPAKYKHMVKDFYKTATGSWMIDLVDGYSTSYGTDYIECRFKRDCIWELINEVSADKLEEALLYHGSPNKSLTKLEIGKEKTTGDEFGTGIYLTKDYNEAKGYSGPNGRVYKVFLDNDNLYDLKELLPQTIKEIVKSELIDNKDIRNQIVRYNRKQYEVKDNKTGFEFYTNKKQEWESLDGIFFGNMPKVNKEGNIVIVTYTDYEDIDSAVDKLTGDDLQKVLSRNMDPNIFVELILRAGYDGIITHNGNWYVIYKNEDKVIIKESKHKVEEASRNELLALTKSQTITRYNKAAGYKGFSIVDIDTTMLLRDDTITVTCRVGNYYDTIQLMDVLIWIQMESERNQNNQVNTKAITQALMEAIDALEIKVNCTCGDWQYRFAYQATQLDYKYGKPENRPANITNPKNYGALCKHLTSMLSNKKWLQQVTSTIMDWIEKNIDQVNKYLRVKEEQELTLPNELARKNAKIGFYSKLFKDKLKDEPEEEVEDNDNNDIDDVGTTNDSDASDNVDNIDNNMDNVEDDNNDLENKDNNNNIDDLDDNFINDKEEVNDNE